MKAPELLNLVGGILPMQTTVEAPATLSVSTSEFLALFLSLTYNLRADFAQPGYDKGIADSRPLLKSLSSARDSLEVNSRVAYELSQSE
jgi:hypothetical protein